MGFSTDVVGRDVAESRRRVERNAPMKRKRKKKRIAEDLAGAFINGRHMVSEKCRK